VEYRELGENGPEVSVLGFGAWPLGGGMGHVDEQAGISTVHAAIDHGITLIDTAQAYRTSESLLGRALKNGYRERCFLATKVSRDYSPQAIRTAIENSLRELGVDYVDLYQIHGWNPKYSVEESLEEMERLRQEGKTRYIGVSNYNARQMERALQTAPIQSNQPRYNMFDREIEAEDLPFCAEQGIGILAHSPLAKGLLTGKYSPDHQFPAEDERADRKRFQGQTFAEYLAVAERLAEIAQEKGLSLVQLAIGWILREPAITCVLVGAKSPAQVQDHLGAVGVQFSEEELDRIDEILADAPEG
jgi:aryl-alcohol dehydrogenase-like predicted oxidoreductase